jgi:hypothetical protein
LGNPVRLRVNCWFAGTASSSFLQPTDVTVIADMRSKLIKGDFDIKSGFEMIKILGAVEGCPFDNLSCSTNT